MYFLNNFRKIFLRRNQAYEVNNENTKNINKIEKS